MSNSNKHRPIAYYSTQLDSVAHAYPSCLKAIATAAKLMDASADLTLGYDVYLQTPLAVQSLNSELTQHFSARRPTSSVILLFSLPNLHLKHCNVLHPAVTISA